MGARRKGHLWQFMGCAAESITLGPVKRLTTSSLCSAKALHFAGQHKRHNLTLYFEAS